ncbi:MAG: GIY-YIG nuclease family protein [Candidatus Omnitrophota bacterium]
MKEWVLYIIKCRDGSLYTGITTDLNKRLRLHNEGKASKYTRSRRPVRLARTEVFNNESSARKREAEVKSLSRAEKLELTAK